MFRVIDDFATLTFEKRDAIGNHLDVFVEANPKNIGCVKVPRFANHGDDLRLCCDERLHSWVILRLNSTASCHAESRHFGVGQLEFAYPSKIFGVFLIRERVSSFDIFHAHLIEASRDLDFIHQRKAYALTLGAIA